MAWKKYVRYAGRPLPEGLASITRFSSGRFTVGLSGADASTLGITKDGRAVVSADVVGKRIGIEPAHGGGGHKVIPIPGGKLMRVCIPRQASQDVGLRYFVPGKYKCKIKDGRAIICLKNGPQ